MDELFNKIREELQETVTKKQAVVLLCGPALKDNEPGAKLRERLQNSLKEENFLVFLGEDEGLEGLRKEFKLYAHTNELLFLKNYCFATIIVASSVGTFCELGLFSDYIDEYDFEFILIIDKKYKKDSSYLNEGPAAAIRDKNGGVYYGDLNDFDYSEILNRLKNRRAAIALNKKRLPRKNRWL